jgi:ATP-dependent protease ClpP protease subunit
MSVYSIPIYGLIGSPESPEDKALYFPFDKFLLHVNKAKEFDMIELDIASDGGYVDVTDKMIDVLKATKKPIISKNSGNIASAASKLFTLAPKGSRSFDPSKGVFLIHNPWGTIEGDANELAAASKELQDTENEYAKWYAGATGSDLNVIKSFMSENIPLTVEQVESLGFATIVKPTVNAVAKLKSSNINQMDNKDVVEKLNGFEKLMQKLFAKLKIKAIMLADTNGKELEFPELTDVSEIAVGVKVSEGGKPADGEYPQPDGTVLVCKAGVLTEIKPKADDTQALKDELAAAKAEIEKLKGEKALVEEKATEAVKVANEVKSEFTKFKAQFSAGDPGSGTPPAGDPGKKEFLTKDELEKMFTN